MFPFLLVRELSSVSATSFPLFTTATPNSLNRLNSLRVRVRITLRVVICRQSFRLVTKSSRLTISSYATSSLTIGWVCRLKLLLALAVILGWESRGTHKNNLLPQARDFPNLEDHDPVFIFPRNRVAFIPSGTGFPFRRLLPLAGLWWRYLTPSPHEVSSLTQFNSTQLIKSKSKSKSKSHCHWRSVNQ
jgi:hypothetical protein